MAPRLYECVGLMLVFPIFHAEQFESEKIERSETKTEAKEKGLPRLTFCDPWKLDDCVFDQGLAPVAKVMLG